MLEHLNPIMIAQAVAAEQENQYREWLHVNPFDTLASMSLRPSSSPLQVSMSSQCQHLAWYMKWAR